MESIPCMESYCGEMINHYDFIKRYLLNLTISIKLLESQTDTMYNIMSP